MWLDKEDDINKVLKYFSYEHFYVIYCKVRLKGHFGSILLSCDVEIKMCREDFQECLLDDVSSAVLGIRCRP